MDGMQQSEIADALGTWCMTASDAAMLCLLDKTKLPCTGTFTATEKKNFNDAVKGVFADWVAR